MKRFSFFDALTFVVLTLGALAALFPFYWMFASATRTTTDVLSIPPRWNIGHALGENFAYLVEQGLLRAALNSTFITLVTSGLTIILAALAGYALTCFRFRGQGTLFVLILLTLFVPLQATVIPLFQLLARLNLLNNPWGVILPALASPFAIFFMRQAFLRYPGELSEAGRIDGASEFQIFWRIALPAVLPSLAALGVFVLLSQWNSFFWPLVVLNNPDQYTLPVALNALAVGSVPPYGALLLGVALATLPILLFYLFAQRLFTSAALGGAVKG